MSCYRVLPGALPPGDEVESVDHLHLEPVPRVAQAARSFVRDRMPPEQEDVIDTVLLLTSELVTNAVIHARTEIEVGITVSSRSVLVTVHDKDLGRSEPAGTGREGGRGLGIVDALADDTGTHRHPGDGKTVWFRLVRTEGDA